MTENSQALLVCESCGENFSCGADTGVCWCFGVNLERERLAELREKFQNCLCEKCLKKKASRAPDKINNVSPDS